MPRHYDSKPLPGVSGNLIFPSVPRRKPLGPCPNCGRYGGKMFLDGGDSEAVCLNCGYREYNGCPAGAPSLRDRREAEFDMLPYPEQVAFFKAKGKKKGPGYYRGNKRLDL